MLRLNILRFTTCLLSLIAMAAGLATSRAQPSIPALGDREAAYVATTPDFAFYSDFWLNMHDYLYGIAGGGPDERAGFEKEAVACTGLLMDERAAGWQAAVDYYSTRMGERHHRRDPLMHSIRHRLANMALGSDPDPELAGVLEILRGAAPAYRACLWESHDARNRRRIGEVVSLLVMYGPVLRGALSRYYRAPWPANITLDVVSYSDYAGANTSALGHTMMSSANTSTAGFEGLELVLHEASHLIFGPRQGVIAAQILTASETLGVEPPDQLWHALSFYTSGEVVDRVAKSAGDNDFEPYALRRGLFGTAFRGYLEPIEQHWRPYLDGEVDLSTAIAGVIAAIDNADQ